MTSLAQIESGGRRPPLRSERVRPRAYSTQKLIQLTGLTRTQVDTLEKKHLVVPMADQSDIGIGAGRLYSETEAFKALVYAILRRDFSAQKATRVLRKMDARGIHLERVEPYILTDGDAVYYAGSDPEIIEIHRRHRGMLLLIAVEDQAHSLRAVA